MRSKNEKEVQAKKEDRALGPARTPLTLWAEDFSILLKLRRLLVKRGKIRVLS